ncbi:hypothetical protein AB0D47_39480 [Streptomyces sp. NPDC048376]|jgi:hypothetical protein|uniref:hypothetical protein n=1 Tax=unclassified Streptomyces TaxID=2593676 RepID=UPI00069AEC39
MERRAGGFNALPHSTAHRIIKYRAVPRTEHQLLGFLIACEAPEERRHLWVEALHKCLAGPDESPPIQAVLATPA